MKNKYAVLCTILATASQTQAADLTGTWTSSDYYCSGVRQPGTVRIAAIDGVYTAIKSQGNACIPSGYLSFYWDSNLNKCEIVVANNNNDKFFTQCTLTQTNLNSFTIFAPSNGGTWVFTKYGPGSVNSFAPAINDTTTSRVDDNLNIYMPQATYNGTDMSVNLRFVPTNDGKFWWQLDKYTVR